MCLSIPLISSIDWILKIWLVTPPPISGTLCVFSLIYIQCNSMAGTLQNVIQATGKVKMHQLTSGILKMLGLPIVYVLFLNGAPVYSYIIVLIIIAVIGLFVQLYIVNKLVPAFNIHYFLLKVTMPEVFAWVVPLTIAVCAWKCDFGFIPHLMQIMLMVLITIISAWIIGLSSSERVWIKKVISERFDKIISR